MPCALTRAPLEPARGLRTRRARPSSSAASEVSKDRVPCAQRRRQTLRPAFAHEYPQTCYVDLTMDDMMCCEGPRRRTESMKGCIARISTSATHCVVLAVRVAAHEIDCRDRVGVASVRTNFLESQVTKVTRYRRAAPLASSVRLMKSSMSGTAAAACVSSSLWPASRTWASILGSARIHDRISARSKKGRGVPRPSGKAAASARDIRRFRRTGRRSSHSP